MRVGTKTEKYSEIYLFVCDNYFAKRHAGPRSTAARISAVTEAAGRESAGAVIRKIRRSPANLPSHASIARPMRSSLEFKRNDEHVVTARCYVVVPSSVSSVYSEGKRKRNGIASAMALCGADVNVRLRLSVRIFCELRLPMPV